MKKLSLLLLGLFITLSGMSQKGFETIIPTEDGVFRDAHHVVETDNHGFIVSCRSKDVYDNDMLLSLSPEGEVNHSLIFQIDDKNIKYCGLYKDTEREDEYIAIAILSSGYTISSYIQNEIAILRIDANLDIKSQSLCSLGDDIINMSSWQLRDLPRFVREDDGNFFMVARCQKTDCYCRLYIRITPEGEIVKIKEDYSNNTQADRLMDLFLINRAKMNYGMIMTQNDGEYYYRIDSTFNSICVARLTSLKIKTVKTNPLQQYPDTTFSYGPRGGKGLSFDDDSFFITSTGYYFKHSNGKVGWCHFLARINDDMTVLDSLTWDCSMASNSIPINRLAATVKALSMGPDGAIFHCGIDGLQDPNQGYMSPTSSHIVISKFDNDLNLLWRRYYGVNDNLYNINGIQSTNDGGCILTGYHAKAPGYPTYYSYILKVDEDGYDAIGENEESLAKPYFCYPNPAKDNIYIEFSPDVNCQSVVIYTLDGHIIETFQETSLQNNTIDISNLNSGVYLMKIRMTDGKEFSEKIIKE
ncbi:MAG: T9SS type A sorting domain-containing protein [Bacteroidales bacterium]|nr:T9SS type A sorting domain-containing protein [Bacteroidales bacterium]